MASGIFTSLAFLAFLGVVYWAWDKRNVERFREAASLPLHDDELRPTKGGKP